MIQIVYVDGSAEEFKSSKFLSVDTENSDDWITITENKYDSDADEYDSDDDVIIAEIRKEQVRKIYYAD